MTADMWSLVASVVSTILGFVAIGLSVTFFIQGAKSSAAAQKTLTTVETLVTTIQRHAFGMLEQTINRILTPPSQLPPNEAGTSSGPSATSDTADKPDSPMNAEVKALDGLYAAEMNLGNPMYNAVLGMMGGGPLLSTERERIRALIAIKRAQLEKEYGVKFDGPLPLPSSAGNPQVPR